MWDLFRRPCQRNVCQLHFYELPFRHLYTGLAGKTKGPKTNEGEIGKLIGAKNMNRPIVPFKPIKVAAAYPSLEEVKTWKKKISSDQKIALELAHAVMKGPKAFLEDKTLAARSCGCLNNSRWLTKAIRLLRAYVSE